MNNRKESERPQHLTRKQRRALERDQRKEQAVQNPSRRRFLAIILGGASALVATTTGVAVWQSRENDQSVERLINKYFGKEKETEPIIKEFERGFVEFSQRVVDLLSKSDTSPEDRRTLQIPLDIFRINLSNPYRNIYLWKRQDLEKSRVTATKHVPVENLNFFFYDFQDIQNGQVAAFVPVTRTMTLSTIYDPNNILDNLIAMHELVHVAQDNHDRETLSQEAYYAFLHIPPSGRRKIVGIYEATAFIEEIYMLNLFTGDQFRSDVISKSGQIDINKYVVLLNARSDQKSTIDFLGRMAFQLYSGQSSVQQIDTMFLEYINRLHKQQGIDVYDRTPSGFALVP